MDIRKAINIVALKNLSESKLASVKVRDIDVDAATAHFDLPYEDQFSSKREMISGFTETKKAFQKIFKGQSIIRVYRGMTVDADWISNLNPGDELGKCWAWDAAGAERFAVGQGGIILVANIHVDDVDWDTSIVTNTIHPDEHEITLEDYADIELLEIRQNGQNTIGTRANQIFSV